MTRATESARLVWSRAPILAVFVLALAAASAHAGLVVTHRGPAWDALVTDRHVVTLDADFRGVTALDPATGAQAWRRVFRADEPRGVHNIYDLGGRIVVYAGPHIVVLDRASGAIIGRVQTAWNRRGCRPVLNYGAAAVLCEEAIWLLDLAPRGADSIRSMKYFPKAEWHIYQDLGQPHDTAWSQTPIGPIGRADDLLVAVIEDDKHRGGLFDVRLVTVGLDWVTGDERWRTSELLREGWKAAGLFARDAMGWFIDDSARGVGVFDTRTGKTRWRRAARVNPEAAPAGKAAPPPPRFDAWWHEPSLGLYAVIDGVARLYDGASGAVRWTRRAPAQVTVLLAGQDLTGHEYIYPERARTLRFLDPGTGAVRHEIAVGAKDRLRGDGARGFTLVTAASPASPAQLREYAPDGALVRAQPVPAGFVGQTFTASAIIGYHNTDTVIYDRATLRALDRVSGHRTVVGELNGHLTLFIGKADQVGEALVLCLACAAPVSPPAPAAPVSRPASALPPAPASPRPPAPATR